MTADQSRFNVINDPFVCENCGKEVPPAKKTCRNHCPFCITSKHVDIMPGDRSNACGGLMDLAAWSWEQSSEMILTFKCRKCGGTIKNRSTHPSDPCPDSLDKILNVKPRPPK